MAARKGELRMMVMLRRRSVREAMTSEEGRRRSCGQDNEQGAKEEGEIGVSG